MAGCVGLLALKPFNFNTLRIEVESPAAPPSPRPFKNGCRTPSLFLISPQTSTAKKAKNLFETTLDLKAFATPLQSKEKGINGVYVIKTRNGHRGAIFKPLQEEGNRLSGDDGIVRLKLGMRNGDAAKNECTSYYLGTKYGVEMPATAFLTLPSPQFQEGVGTGSVQEFKRGKPVKAFRPSILKRIFKKMPLCEFHQLFFLDLLSGNTDRHTGNLLIDGNKFHKIDHGCCLTASLANQEDHCWLKWDVKALHTPFDLSLVSHFDWETDAQEIQKAFPDFSPEALVILKLRMHLLEKGTQAGLTPFELAQFFGLFGAMSILYNRLEDSLTKSEEEKFIAIGWVKKSIDVCIAELAGKKADPSYDPKKAGSIVSKCASNIK